MARQNVFKQELAILDYAHVDGLDGFKLDVAKLEHAYNVDYTFSGYKDCRY